MSGFLLDTNVPSELVRSLPEPKVTAWFASQDLESLYFSVVSFGELRKGLTIMPSGQRRTQLETWLETDLFRLFAGRVLPITQSIANAGAPWKDNANSEAVPSASQTPKSPRPSAP